MHFEKQRANYIIESGTQSSTGDNACASLCRIEEQMLTRARHLEEETILWPRISGTKDRVGHTFRVINPALER